MRKVKDMMDNSCAARRLMEMERRYLCLFEYHPDAVFEMNREGLLVNVNSHCSLLSGFSREELLAMNMGRLIVGEQDNAQAEYYFKRTLQGNPEQFELTVRHKSGSIIYIQCTTIPITIDGSVEVIFGIVKDITEQKETKHQMNLMTNFDLLTGLPNRRLFLQRLEQLHDGDASQLHAVLTINLDRFEFINESLGYAKGELLLQQFSSLLRQLFSPEAVIARLQGDEFAVLLPDIASEQAAASAAQSLVAKLLSPIYMEGMEVVVSASIGITLAGKNREFEPGRLLRESNIAMRHVRKLHQERRYAIYNEAMDSQFTNRLQLESGLRKAILLDQMYLRYQPIINVVTGKIEAVEALLRWDHPELGFVSPADFIPIAEETGDIIAIGNWVLRSALRQVCQWHREGLKLRVGVNVSLVQLKEPDFPQLVGAILAESGLKAGWLDIEVTESVLIEDQEMTKSRLAALRKLGVHIAIDDFGTGYTSLNYLKTFPIDYLKIDRSFVKDINHDLNNNIILSSLINLAHYLDIQVIGEGIETQEHIDFLREKGCDEGQGYLISAAVDEQEIRRLYLKHNGRENA